MIAVGDLFLMQRTGGARGRECQHGRSEIGNRRRDKAKTHELTASCQHVVSARKQRVLRGYGCPGRHSCSVVLACLALWPMDRISNADAYSLEQVRKADYATNCGLGFAGQQCNEVMTCEELDYCNGNGMCQRGGFCLCDPGWEGATCMQANCASNCSGHGSCATTGGCVCDAGFTGVICNQVICLGGGNCTGHGTCLTGGICVCEKGYLGAGCDVIDVAKKCSNHGYPDEHGNCQCDLWYTGPDCSLALCLNNCSDHGACDSHSGTCWCDPGWSSADCSKKLCQNNCTGHGTCFQGECWCQEGFSGEDCSTFPCLNSCSGHGSCSNGTCACDNLWTGSDCSLFANYLLECAGNCTGRGTCMNSTCHCDPGWSGEDCAAPVDCPGNCTGHGMCYNATCVCDLGFSGADCGLTHCLNNCSSHGTCTRNATCACDPSFHGADCSLPDLTCGTGFQGNCSGHGACVDSAINQWWSGSSRLPDLWAWEEPSRHLVRRDVASLGEHTLGRCVTDFYGIPSIVENQAVIAIAGNERVLKSNGVPEHFVMHNGFPLCEVSWSISVSAQPRHVRGPCHYDWPLPRSAQCPTPHPLPIDTPIAYALNGVPIWGALLSDGSNAVEGPDPVPCYGHSSRTGMWHYHHPFFGCNMAANQETLLGYALDGYAIYGPLAGTKDDVDAILDKCNGRALADGSYRYHVRSLAQVDETAPYRDGERDPRNPKGDVAHTNWNYVLGCFSGTPMTSLGLRRVIAPLMTESDKWVSHQDNTALTTRSIADQFGLTARIGICVCDSGWIGSDCRTLGCLNNCSSNGFCEANETSARCSCDYMWEGDDCSKRVNTTCSKGCSGHGTCLWENHANASCLCDRGWLGGNCQDPPPCPFNCSGHGSCFNRTCVCDHMYDGEGCEMPSALALNLNLTSCWQLIGNVLTNNSCSGQGTCFNGTCLCDAGWVGINCSVPFVPDPVFVECANNCSFHGACSFVFDPFHVTYNGSCICDAGFAGPDCSIDWGQHQCEGNCSAHGSCVNRTCICDPGWTGFDCNGKWESPFRLCPMNCSNHGSCFNGTCTCDRGWNGANCSLPNPCPADCSGHGVCTLGNCTCDPDWAGEDCSHQSYCPGFLPKLGVNCSGHGMCQDGFCFCDDSWSGHDCSEKGCINSCSNNGLCHNGTCECHIGFIGQDCSLGPYSGECPNGCSGHGACSVVQKVSLPEDISDVRGDGLLSGSIGCVCDDLWEGPDCSLRSCPNHCSGNGACAQNGTCYCYSNWAGDDCSEAWCPNECNDHGICVGGQGCLCDIGYEGVDCRVSACPGNCTGRGVCVHTPGLQYTERMFENDAERGYETIVNNSFSSCLCFYGWGGSDCSEMSCPLNCSFPQGQCNNGTCVCDIIQGYYGRNCSERFGLVELRTDGNALTPSYGIFEGKSIVTIRGTGFVSSDTMRCKFGSKEVLATLVQPNPPEVPFAICLSPGEKNPQNVMFQFSLDNRGWTAVDARIQFIYHGQGLVTKMRWPTGPAQGGSIVTFFGLNFQYALGVKCKFGTFEVLGDFNTRFIEDPVTEQQELEAQLSCQVPPLSDLQLPEGSGNTVVLWVSMDMGQNWMRYEKDYLFSYYGLTKISPSFGPQQDQNTVISMYGFNFYQGAGRQDLFLGFKYDYTCVFRVPWMADPVVVKSPSQSWTPVTAPPDGSRFACKVPPGLTGESGYTGPVEVGISLNPCIHDPEATTNELGCFDSLPYTTEPILFHYVQNTVDSLSATLGPTFGGTIVTITGVAFERRDRGALPFPYVHLPILCKWGTVVTEGVYNGNEHSVTCVSPECVAASCTALQHSSCPDCAVPVQLEVALNGLDYTDSRVEFFYARDPQIQRIYPTLGSILGGTTVTVESLGFHDPCVNCLLRGDCDSCGGLVVCQFLRQNRVQFTSGACVRDNDGVCDPKLIRCPVPEGRALRANVVSLEPFYIALSVSVDNQTFFPFNLDARAPYNVFDPPCQDDQTTGCSFLFKFYEIPILTSVFPTAIPGNGGGRVTVTGVNFLNENGLRCRYGSTLGPAACRSGATGDFTAVSTVDFCVGAVSESPIFISSDTVICGTVGLPNSITSTSVGLSFNGGDGAYDTYWLMDENLDIRQSALQVYWALAVQPTLGFRSGGTRVTVTGVNLEAVGTGGDNTNMRCRFGDSVVYPDPQQVPDPVDYRDGTIQCISPTNVHSVGSQETVIFGICLIGIDCEYTGKEKQASPTDTHMPTVNHFTKSLRFLYYTAPVLNSLTPSLGPREGSTFVTVKGVGFFESDVLKCRFDDAHFSTDSTFIDTSTVVCKTPAMTSATQYNVEITLNDQQFSSGCPGVDNSIPPPDNTGFCWYYFYVEPIITSVAPQAGINTGSTQVVLTVQSPVTVFYELACRFYPSYAPDVERLATADLRLVVPAEASGNTVSCFAPSSASLSGEPMLHTATKDQPNRGLTFVSVTWNGQQFGPYDESADTQRFWFHDKVEALSLVPSGGPVDTGMRVTLYGSNFVNTSSLTLQIGETLYLCSPNAAISRCPNDDSHVRDAITFLSSQELVFTVPMSSNAVRKTIRVSNNGLPSEFSTVNVVYQYYSKSQICPNDCRGVAPSGSRGHGTCEATGCECNPGYSGFDCSIGPTIVLLEPSSGLATGGWHVTITGRNLWIDGDVSGTSNAFKEILLDSRVQVEAVAVIDTSQLVFVVPTTGMRIAPTGIAVEVTVNGIDYTVDGRLLQLFGYPSISGFLPNGAHYSGGVSVTVSGTNFVDSEMLRVRLGPNVSLASCHSSDELCMRGVYVSASAIVFVTKPCHDRCHYGGPLLVQLALNGVNFVDTQQYFRFLEDTQITLIEPRVGSMYGDTPVVITATNMNSTTGFTCKFGDQVVRGSFLQDTGKLLCKTPASLINHTVPVTIALDGQSYTSSPDCQTASDSNRCFIYTSPLDIKRVYPSLGPYEGGTRITIIGSGFYGVQGVQGLCRFSSTTPNVPTLTSKMLFLDETHFTCTSPPFVNVPIEEVYDFRVAANGVDFEQYPFFYQTYAHPTLIAGVDESVNPIGSPLNGGTSVTISGTGFIDSKDGIRVRWVVQRTDVDTGEVTVVSSYTSGKAKFVSNTRIVVVTGKYPYGPATTRLSVSLNDGTDYSSPAPNDFVFYQTPTITAITPPLGPRLGETSVVVTGAGFVKLRSVAKCAFGDQHVPAVFDDSDVAGAAVFRCKSPPWPVPDWVNVELAMDGQVFTEVKVIKFQYYGEFDVDSVVPAGGPKAGGTEVTVTGVGLFMSGSYLSCFFGDGDFECKDGMTYPCYRAVDATFLSETSVSCVSPEIPTGGSLVTQYPIRVGLNGAYSQACPNTRSDYQCALKSALSFTYYDDVFVIGLSPNSGQVQGGTEMTVYGSGFRTDLSARTRCMFTRCTGDDIYLSGPDFGKFKDPKMASSEVTPRCSGETVFSPMTSGAVGVLSTSIIRCQSPVASTATSHFTLFDLSLNKGVTNQNLYGPLCQNGCPVMYFYYALPTMSFNVPSLGPVVGGTVVTVNGVGFIGFQNTAIRCKFGDVESTPQTTGAEVAVRFLTDSTISCVAPAQAASTVRISVSLNGIQSDFTLAELGAPYRYHEPPKLTGIPTPTLSPTSGGAVVTLSGTGFLDGDLQCKFWTGLAKGNLNRIVRADYVSTTEVSCTTPSVQEAQLVSISLSLNGQDFSPFFYEDLFYYFPTPEIFEIYPRGGPAESGGHALVRGKGFLNSAGILCRVGVAVTTGTFVNDTFVQCVIPQIQRKIYSQTVESLGIQPEILPDSFAVYPVQAYPIEISVDGQTFSDSGIKYTYYSTPVLDQIVPNSGAKSALTTVAIINGANFRNDFGGPFCRFAGVGATKAVFMSDRSIRCQIPPMELGQRVLVEISINGQEYESHTSILFSFMGEAPILERASMSSSFDVISLAFDVNTDRGMQFGTFPCGKILKWRPEDLTLPSSGLSAKDVLDLGASPADQTVFQALFGFGVMCRWETNQTATIILGAFPKFKLGYPIWLKENRFRRGIELTYYASGNATILSPHATNKPEAMLASPSEIGRCDSLVIDASQSSGGLGRPLYFSWVLDLNNSVVLDDNKDNKVEILESLSSIVASFSGQAFDAGGSHCQNPACLVQATNSSESRYENCACNVISLPFASYPQGRYTVQLQVSNWQNVASEPAAITVTKQWLAIPTVSIDMYAGDHGRLLHVNRSLSLSGSASGSACKTSPPTLLFQWFILDADSTPVPLDTSVQSTVKSLILPPYSLLPGRTYHAQLNVTDKDATCILPDICKPPTYTENQCCVVGSDTVLLKTATSPPVAQISGGERTVSADSEMQLDGSGTFHPDFPGSSQPKLQYKWTCQDSPTLGTSSTGGCFSEGLLTTFGYGDEKQLLIPSGSMRTRVQNEVGTYVPVVYDFSLNVSDGISWSTATVRVHPSSDAVPIVSVVIRDAQRVYAANKRMTLTSVVEPVAAEPSSLLFQWSTVSGDVDLTKIQHLESPTSREPSLVIKPSILTAGQQYTVRLSVTEGGVSGYAQVTFTMDNPPSGGILEVSPSEGTSLDTVFRLSAVSWQADPETLPLTYAFEYFQRGTRKFRIIQGASEVSEVSANLPPGDASDMHVLALQLRVGNTVGSEALATTCNLVASDCLVTVQPKVFASTDEMLTDLSSRTSQVEDLINAGDANAAINYAGLLLSTINSAAGATRRRTLLQAVNNSALAQFKCGTVAPLLFQALPSNGLKGHPSAQSIARSSASQTLSLFSVPAQVNDACLVQMDQIYKVVLEHVSRGSSVTWAADPDLVLLQDLADTISMAVKAVQEQYTNAAVSHATTAARIATLITQHENITAARSYGAITGEAAKNLDSSMTRSKSWRVSTPTASAVARSTHRGPAPSGDSTGDSRLVSHAHHAHADRADRAQRAVYAGGRRLLTTTYPGTTRLPALSGSFSQTSFAMPENVLPFAINKVGCSTGSNGAQVCEVASVSAVASQYSDLFNPHFYSPDAQFVIAPVMSIQLQAFGLQEVIPVADLANDITFDSVLTRVPDSTRDAAGRHHVAACVWWNGTRWDTSGCRLSRIASAEGGGNDMRAICLCNHTSAHTVLDAASGCDGVPYSTVVYDGCGVCDGDGSTCLGCDGKVASGKVLDGCGKCGGDNSSCSGCDGVPYSGKVIDACNVCGGDDSSCKGCDGVAVHPYVTARFPSKKPKEFDSCTSAEFPLGVCGGCDASCKGCNGQVNSGKSYDKCGKCGEYANEAEAANDGMAAGEWYARSSKDNCSLGLKQCGTGLVPDSCGVCVPFEAPASVRNQQCMGCDGVASVFSFQNGARQAGGLTRDRCGVCGGNDCSCVDCRGVVGGSARDDRCGICEGNNTCLDCAGIPYGVTVVDACGICGGTNNTELCRGCDGKLHPLGPTWENLGGVRPASGSELTHNAALARALLLKPDVQTKSSSSACPIAGAASSQPQQPQSLKVLSGAEWLGFAITVHNNHFIKAGDSYYRPVLMPPRLDRYGKSSLSVCCPQENIGCNDICGASVGCDCQCTTTPLLTDKCGVCGGTGAPNTGNCDCAAVSNGNSSVGCDGKCSDPPAKIDMCGVCGGADERETGTCDCERIPYGAAVRDSSGVCCYLSDMGCGSSNLTRCFSGKTWDVCNVCGGDGGTCVASRPSDATSREPPTATSLALTLTILHLLLMLGSSRGCW